MPSRGSYQVANGEDPMPPPAKTSVQKPFLDPEKCQPPSRPDTSFRDCVLSLALVLLVIAILVLAVHPWDRNGNDPAHHHGGASEVHGSKTKTTTTTTKTEATTTKAEATTTLHVERHGVMEKESDQNENEDNDESSSSESSMATSTTTSTTASPETKIEDFGGEVEENPSPFTTQPETTLTTMTSTIYNEQFWRKPQNKPIADETDIDPMTTTTIQGGADREEVTDQSQVGGDQTDDDTKGSTNSQLMETTNEDFGMAVGFFGPTTPSGDDGVTTQSTWQETQTTQLIEKSARLLVAGTTPANEETTTTPADEGTTTAQNQKTTLKKVNPKLSECSTPACKKQAARMLGLMDHGMDVCQDFYQHACGGLRDNALLVEEDARAEAMGRIEGKLAEVDISVSSSALSKFRRFYDLCIENVGDKDKRINKFSTSAKDAVEGIDKLHTKDSWKNAPFDLTYLLTRLMLQHSTPLIDVTLDVSSDTPGKFALKVTPPVTPSLLRTGPARPSCSQVAAEETDLNKVYAQYLNCMSNHSRYLQEVNAAVVALRLFPQADSRQREVLVEEIRQTIELDVWEKDLLETLPVEGEKRRQLLAKEYHRMTVRNIQDTYPMIDWRKLFSGLLNISVAELPDSAEVQVYFQPYLDKLFSNLENKDPRTLHNTLLAMYAHDLYVNALNGGPRYLRKEHCLTVAAALMEDVASALYLSSFNSATLDAMEHESQATFNRLRETMELQLKDAKWLDEGSLSDVVAKLHEMRIDASGGRDLFTDLAAIDQRMAGIDLDVSNDFIKLSTALTARYRQLMYSLYDKNPNNTEAGWSHFLLPYSTTAVSVYGLNSVMVPFGLLTWPLYDPAVPRHITLARLGFVIAHEMAHHFDSTGIKYRAGGGRGDSVLMGGSSVVFDDYLNMECLVKMRYSMEASLTEPDNSTYVFNLGGEKLSQNERLADSTANALSLDTALRWQQSTETDPVLPYLGLTPAQEHYLAVAQMFCTKSGVESWRVELFEREHLPSTYRINDMIQNSVAFPVAFNCAAGGPMSPSSRCEVFPALTSDEGILDYSAAPTSQ